MRSDFDTTPRTAVRRHPERARYDRDAVYAIIDEALFCHVGFVMDGRAVVIPTLHARVGDTLYIHGAASGRMLQAMASGAEVCVAMTLVDGLVLARSAFHHSINYRSVVVFGTTREVNNDAQKVAALRATVEHVVPGRWNDVRLPNPSELKATSVVALALQEASAKVRTGPPRDSVDDHRLPIWAGVIPLVLAALPPVPDEQLVEGIQPPRYTLNYDRSRMAESKNLQRVLEVLQDISRQRTPRSSRAVAAAELIRRAGGYRWVAIYQVADDRISALGWTGEAAPAFPNFPSTQGLNGAAVQSGHPVVVQDVRQDPRYLTTFGSTLSEAVFPIHAEDGRIRGTLDVESERVNAFTTKDEEFLAACVPVLAALWI